MNERLKQVIEYLGLTTRSLEANCGITQGILAKILREGTSMNVSVLEKINKKYPNIDLHWLVTGEGDMLYSRDGEAVDNIIDRDNYEIIAKLARQLATFAAYEKQKNKK